MAIKAVHEHVGITDELTSIVSTRILVFIVLGLYCVYLYISKALEYRVRPWQD